jgi:hypothetical protein
MAWKGEGLMPNLLKNYFFWTYERGSYHYDIMVTAILAFMFLSPRFIKFNDSPVQTVALRSSEILVKEDGRVGDQARFIYQIRADDMGQAVSDADRRRRIMHLIEPISGEVTLLRYDEVKDSSGHVIAYDATVLR